ncbi:prolyl oligopeptidase family serine peptidase [Streptomyces cyaneofuscatus]|uniref:prolyl oligopeptidase family serine peptidase n=1 Tax=Streptomyces cyaneofuscatus TaxID=66883 RepID=UPI0036D879D9
MVGAAQLFAERERALLTWADGEPVCVSFGEDGLIVEDALGRAQRTLADGAELAVFSGSEELLFSLHAHPDSWEVRETALTGAYESWSVPPAELGTGGLLCDAVIGVAQHGRRCLVVTAAGAELSYWEIARETGARRLTLPGTGRLLAYDRSLDAVVLEDDRGPNPPALRLHRCDGHPVATVEGRLLDTWDGQLLLENGNGLEVRRIEDFSLVRHVEVTGEVSDARFLRGGDRLLVVTCEEGQDRARLTGPWAPVPTEGALRLCAAHPGGIGLHSVSTLGASAWTWVGPDGSVRTAGGVVPHSGLAATTAHVRHGATPFVLHRPLGEVTGLVVAVHGGPEAVERDELRWEGVYRDLLAAGVAVAGLNYAGSTGYGPGHRAAPRHRWEASLREDVAACVELGRDLGVGLSRTVLLGGSFGASIALLAAERLTGLGGVVACSPMVSLAGFRERTEKAHPACADWFEERFSPADHELFSAASLTRTGDTPVVVVQGTEDEVVDPGETLSLVADARAAGLAWSSVVEEGMGHQPGSPEQSAARRTLLRTRLLGLLGRGPARPVPWAPDPEVLSRDPGDLVLPPRVPFARPDRPGRLIVFDGVDGCGKSTALRLTLAHLTAMGVEAQAAQLLSPECRDLPYFRTHSSDVTAPLRRETDQPSLALVCLGDRLLRFRTEYRQKLAAGRWLLVDRYVFTGLAEAMAFGVADEDLRVLAELSGLLPEPDLVFLPQVSPERAIQRIQERPDERHHRLDLGFHRRTSAAFRLLGEQYGAVTFDADAGSDAALAAIRHQVDPLIHMSPEEER